MEILGVGIQELLLVAALIVIVVGPRRLPEMAYYLGRGVKKLQRYARVVRDEFSEEFAYLNEEMEAVRADVQEMRTTVTEVRDELQEVRGEVDEVTSEAVGELSDVRAGIEQVATGAGEGAESASPAPGAGAPAAAATDRAPGPRRCGWSGRPWPPLPLRPALRRKKWRTRLRRNLRSRSSSNPHGH